MNVTFLGMHICCIAEFAIPPEAFPTWVAAIQMYECLEHHVLRELNSLNSNKVADIMSGHGHDGLREAFRKPEVPGSVCTPGRQESGGMPNDFWMLLLCYSDQSSTKVTPESPDLDHYMTHIGFRISRKACGKYLNSCLVPIELLPSHGRAYQWCSNSYYLFLVSALPLAGILESASTVDC